jgi:uncharacterized protein YjbI with pentapeptide repeats
MITDKSMQQKSFLQAIGKSFYDSIGDIVFGMEDGTVSIFGLVFGVASSTTSSSVVLLAGATGANLANADLTGADLSGANLMMANLGGSNLNWARLTDAIITEEQLSTVKSRLEETL